MILLQYANGRKTENTITMGKGSSHSVIPDGAKHYGLQVSGAKTSEGQRIIDAIKRG